MTIAPNPPLEAVRQLLAGAGLVASDLTPALLEHFFAWRQDHAVVGVVGLEMFADVGLLRSLAVAADRRGKGLGKALLTYAEVYARAWGVRSLYLLTTTAEAFFEARGWSVCPRDAAPAAIRGTTEFSALCPAAAVLMTKALFEPGARPKPTPKGNRS